MEFRLRGYSYRSVDEARERLEEKARLHAEMYAARGGMSPEEYRARLRELDEQPGEGEYSVVITEETLEQVDEHNVITRNRYGAEVLNSRDTCFLDVDHVPMGALARGLRLFGMGRSEEEELLERVRKLCREDASLGVRVYRTGRGWRLAAEAEGLAPVSPGMAKLCERLDVDELYRKLCEKQGCWRARLTPKPWRVGVRERYPQPEASDAVGEAAAEWLSQYGQRCAGVAVCRLVEQVGRPLRSRMIELHDERTMALKPDLALC